MPRIDNKLFYELAIEKYGTSAKGVNWHSKQSQEIRFETILEILPSQMQNYSVVDIGCGFGDLYSYMVKNNRKPKNYIGIDSLDKMCEIAQRTQQTIIKADAIKDKLPHADFYICSGALNILTKFETYIFIRKCVEASRIAFIFNALHGKEDSETYNYLVFDEIYNIAGDLNVEVSELKDDYLDNDMTVMFTKSTN